MAEPTPNPVDTNMPDPAFPLFRIVVEYQPTIEATAGDMELYMSTVMAEIKSIQAPKIHVVRATIQRED